MNEIDQMTSEVGWYYSSVVQWMPEYSTEKINGYTGPFINQTEALEALFIELDDDIESIKRERDNEMTKFSALSSMYDNEVSENKRLRKALEAIAKPYSQDYSKEYVAADRRYIAVNALNGHETTRPDFDEEIGRI